MIIRNRLRKLPGILTNTATVVVDHGSQRIGTGMVRVIAVGYRNQGVPIDIHIIRIKGR